MTPKGVAVNIDHRADMSVLSKTKTSMRRSTTFSHDQAGSSPTYSQMDTSAYTSYVAYGPSLYLVPHVGSIVLTYTLWGQPHFKNGTSPRIAAAADRRRLNAITLDPRDV
jgi:hypothetical protein